MSEERESEVMVDFEDEDAIRSMIDFAMSIEEAEEELFDHYANEVIWVIWLMTISLKNLIQVVRW